MLIKGKHLLLYVIFNVQGKHLLAYGLQKASHNFSPHSYVT